MRCAKNRSNGQPCQAQAVTGTDACRVHAGRPLDQQKARGEIVTTLRRWGADDIPEEPGLLALRLMTITSWRQQAYEAEIDRVLTETGLPLSEALIGDSIVVDKDGGDHKVGEYIRGIVQVEQTERKLAAELAFKVLAANVSERITRVQEQTAALFVEYVRTILADPELGLTVEQAARAPQVAARHLRALAGGSSS